MSAQLSSGNSLLEWLFKYIGLKQKDPKQKPHNKKNGRVPTDEFLALHAEIEKLKKATEEFNSITVWDEEFETQMREVHKKAGIPMPELL